MKARIPLSPEKKKFTVNGTVRKEFYFMADVSISNLNCGLYEAIDRSVWISMYGPRASGKSTRMEAACVDLSEKYLTLNINIQGFCGDGSSVNVFWSRLYSELVKKYRNVLVEVDRSEVTTACVERFSFLFRRTSDDEKKIVLFLDEFDSLRPHQLIVDDVLSNLRSMKQNSNGCRLQSVVVVGVYGVQRMNTSTGSPFNTTDSVMSPSLTLDGVRAMFSEYVASRSNIKISESVVDDIYERARGHAGLISLCGKAIDEHVAKGSAVDLTLESWKHLSRLCILCSTQYTQIVRSNLRVKK